MPVLDARRFSPTALASLASDGDHLATVLEVVKLQVRGLQRRLDQLRRLEVPAGAARLQRDLETHQLSARLHVLSRLGNELCLGRFDRADGSRVYVGRLGLRNADGRQLLVDWRTPEAEPFFAATLASPMGSCGGAGSGGRKASSSIAGTSGSTSTSRMSTPVCRTRRAPSWLRSRRGAPAG